MSRLNGWWTRLRRAIRQREFERQMADEMREHVERATAQRIAEGEDPVTARRRATLAFGPADAYQEAVRDRRLGRLLEQTWRDVRFALRQLRKAPAFTAIAVSTIAIGIGAGTAVFSLVNAVLLRSLPVPNPQELRILHWSGADVRMRSINHDYSETIGDRRYSESVNHPTFLQLRERAAGIADVFAFWPLDDLTAVTGEGAVSADGLLVSDNFFTGLGVRPFIGRLFQPGDDRAARPLVVISHDLWRRSFNGDPGVLGRTVTMQGRDHIVIGVLPRGFRGVRPGAAPGLYVPMLSDSPFLYVPLSEDWHWFIRLMARVEPGTSDARLASALTAAFAVNASDRLKEPRIDVRPGRGGLAFDRDAYGRPLVVMLGVTGLVLLVACANLAGLSLARGASRRHEVALRVALGAARRRLIAQSLTESALLAAAGGALGLLIALWGRSLISGLLAGSADGLRYDLSLDAAVLGAALAATAATALLSGLLPAWRAAGVNPVDGLKTRGTAGAPRLRAGRLLVACQIGVSLSVLAGAGLGLRTLVNLRQIDAGFQPADVMVFDLNPGAAGHRGETLTRYYDRVQESLEAIPGVTRAALIDIPLLLGRSSTGGFRLTGDRGGDAQDRQTNRLTVNEPFFETLGVPILEGRGFSAADSVRAPKVVIVNETFARRFTDGRSPIGRTLTMWGAEWQIVGVCGDVRLTDLRADAPATTYFPFRQRFYDRFADNAMRRTSFVVRSPLPPEVLAPAITRAVAAIDPEVPATGFTTQTTLVDRAIGQERLLATLGGALAGITLLLCSIGLYGLIAYDITRRTREIAIRRAVGAQRADVARPILREALAVTALGIAVGVPVAYAVTRLIGSQLYGVSAHDPATIAMVVATLLGVAAAAAWLPTRRATRIEPLAALRGGDQ